MLTLSTSAKILITTVAKVKNHVITSREVGIHKNLEKALGPLLDRFSRDSVEEQIIQEWLLFFEASTFYNSQVKSSKVTSVLAQAQKRLRQSKDWQRLKVMPHELREKVQRRLEAERLFRFKKKASVLPVSPSEIETEYTQNRIRYGSQTLAEVKEKIRQNKIEEDLQSRMSQWFKILEDKYKVQRFTKFGS